MPKPLTAAPVGQPSPEGFLHWVGTLADRFQHAVEHSDLWRVLWDDKLAKPRSELIVHASAAAMWKSLCGLADVDMSREPNAGRGPVDFKFSAGWHRRALIEVKLLSSSKLFQGADAQLPEYLASEQVSCAYYICVGFTDRDLRPRAPRAGPRHLRRLRGAIGVHGRATVHRRAPETLRFTPTHRRQVTRQSRVSTVNPHADDTLLALTASEPLSPLRVAVSTPPRRRTGIG